MPTALVVVYHPRDFNLERFDYEVFAPERPLPISEKPDFATRLEGS